jgi:S-adenosylmethionine:tRNA ribosyltransferase-isomerase
MDVALFDFELPEELIALRPASPRESARLLVVHADGSLQHAHVGDLPEFLHAGDLLVVNDTKVIPARLRGRRLPRAGAEGQGPGIEVMLHKRLSPSCFLAFARPARKLARGDALALGTELRAEVLARGDAGEVEIEFNCAGAELDAAIAREGEMPLPPYIAGKRKADAQDACDYQTIYADRAGSVAAPTAGFHFTPDLFARLAAAGVSKERVTLHVGAGTFLPVSAADTSGHHMHSEWAEIDQPAADSINATRARNGRVVCVGTTSLRTLESAVDRDRHVAPFRAETDIFITPGYRFKAADVLLTNFHLPRSTLFMLVCAFIGTDIMKHAYAEAIAACYRFYSYGDACLLMPART